MEQNSFYIIGTTLCVSGSGNTGGSANVMSLIDSITDTNAKFIVVSPESFAKQETIYKVPYSPLL